ncbi:hypothetical protein MC885_011005 [Smutsia gigantea]|nr:hypothetical protein MC885_011005 [Smutsia gigantea]
MAGNFFPPLGLLAVFFCHKVSSPSPRVSQAGLRNPLLKLPSLQTWKANRNSKWEDAYINSGRTVWMDVFSILIGLGLIYAYAL